MVGVGGSYGKVLRGHFLHLSFSGSMCAGGVYLPTFVEIKTKMIEWIEGRGSLRYKGAGRGAGGCVLCYQRGTNVVIKSERSSNPKKGGRRKAAHTLVCCKSCVGDVCTLALHTSKAWFRVTGLGVRLGCARKCQVDVTTYNQSYNSPFFVVIFQFSKGVLLKKN